MLHKSLNLIADSLELLVNDLVGGKRSRGRKSRTYTRPVRVKRSRKQSRLVLNQQAQLRLAGKLNRVLPRDVATSVLNDIKRCAA